MNPPMLIDEAGYFHGAMSFAFRLTNFATTARGDVRKAMETRLHDHSLPMTTAS